MHSKAVYRCTIVAVSLGLAACHHDNAGSEAAPPADDAGAPAPQAATPAPNARATQNSGTVLADATGANASTPSGRKGLGLTDAQIVTALRTINTGEISEAKLAVQRAKDVGVEHFAKTMIAQHGQAVKDIDALEKKLGLSPTDSPLAKQLDATAHTTEQELARTSATSFDKVYMQDQITAHRAALDTIDTDLLPAASDDALRDALTAARATVAKHLGMAHTIFTTLK